jgi:hypothetical protein
MSGKDRFWATLPKEPPSRAQKGPLGAPKGALRKPYIENLSKVQILAGCTSRALSHTRLKTYISRNFNKKLLFS